MPRSLSSLIDDLPKTVPDDARERLRDARTKGLFSALIVACVIIGMCFLLMLNMMNELDTLRTDQVLDLESIGSGTAVNSTQVGRLTEAYNNQRVQLTLALAELDSLTARLREQEKNITGLEERLFLYDQMVVYAGAAEDLYHRDGCEKLGADPQPYIREQIERYGFRPCPDCYTSG